jgi:hypothetical protein
MALGITMDQLQSQLRLAIMHNHQFDAHLFDVLIGVRQVGCVMMRMAQGYLCAPDIYAMLVTVGVELRSCASE